MSKSYTIRNVERQQQINDFANMTIGATDLDGIIEYKNKAYVFFEIKYKNTRLSLGQKIALERLVIDTTKLGKKAILLVCEHDVKDTNVSVDVANCKVRAYFFAGKWYYPEQMLKVNYIVEKFLDL